MTRLLNAPSKIEKKQKKKDEKEENDLVHVLYIREAKGQLLRSIDFRQRAASRRVVVS